MTGKHGKQANKSQHEVLLEFLLNNSLSQLISQATRPTSNSILDLLITSFQCLIENKQTALGILNHLAIILDVNLKPHIPKKSLITSSHKNYVNNIIGSKLVDNQCRHSKVVQMLVMLTIADTHTQRTDTHTQRQDTHTHRGKTHTHREGTDTHTQREQTHTHRTVSINDKQCSPAYGRFRRRTGMPQRGHPRNRSAGRHSRGT